MTTIDVPRAGTPATGPSPLRWRRRWLDMDRNQLVLQWAQTLPGQVVLHVGFLSLLALLPVVRTKHFVLVAIALIACAILPSRRMTVLTGVGVLYFLLRPLKLEPHFIFFDELWASFDVPLSSQIGFVAFGLVFILFAALAIRNQRSRRFAFAAQRPVLAMFLLCIGLVSATMLIPAAHPAFAAAWIALAYLTGSFFFLGYILLDNRAKAPLPEAQQLGFLRPVWASGTVPIKGPNYFRKFEATNGEELARTRLKALKLVVWATILYWVWALGFDRGLHDLLALPRLEEAIFAKAAGKPDTLALRWSIVAADFLSRIPIVGAHIHAFVAIIRMAGFQIPRGMAKPLASRTISEFWGRYLFYFKEILADFFFYPTFQRYFKRHPRLRIAFATFAAAFVGNILFDMISSAPSIAIDGFVDTMDNFYSYAIYAGLLTCGLVWSQIAQKRPKPEDGWFRYDVLPRVQVILFFALLQVFDDSGGLLPVGDRITFFFSLFGAAS